MALAAALLSWLLDPLCLKDRGVPIELTETRTRAVYGDDVGVYAIQRVLEDRATVPIYHESRLARIELAEGPSIDPEFEGTRVIEERLDRARETGESDRRRNEIGTAEDEAAVCKRILRKHGHPPDKREKVTGTALPQAEVLSNRRAA